MPPCDDSLSESVLVYRAEPVRNPPWHVLIWNQRKKAFSHRGGWEAGRPGGWGKGPPCFLLGELSRSAWVDHREREAESKSWGAVLRAFESLVTEARNNPDFSLSLFYESIHIPFLPKLVWVAKVRHAKFKNSPITHHFCLKKSMDVYTNIRRAFAHLNFKSLSMTLFSF